MKSSRRAFVFAALTMAPAWVLAQVTDSIAPADLDFVADRWRAFRSLPRPKQKEVREAFITFQRLSPERQREIREWATKWQALDAAERELVRGRLIRWRSWPADERAQVMERWQKSKQAP